MSDLRLKSIEGNDVGLESALSSASLPTDDLSDSGRAFAQAARYLKNRISLFVNLPIASVDRMALEIKLSEIGRIEGSTASDGDKT